MTFTQKEQVLNVWLLSILSISQRVHLRSSVSVIKRTSSYSVLSVQIQSARVSGLYYTYCRDQQYCRLKAVMQKQTNTEQGIQMNRKLRTSSGYNGLSVSTEKKCNGSDAAAAAAFRLSNQHVCTLFTVWKTSLWLSLD